MGVLSYKIFAATGATLVLSICHTSRASALVPSAGHRLPLEPFYYFIRIRSNNCQYGRRCLYGTRVSLHQVMLRDRNTVYQVNVVDLDPVVRRRMDFIWHSSNKQENVKNQIMLRSRNRSLCPPVTQPRSDLHLKMLRDNANAELRDRVEEVKATTKRGCCSNDTLSAQRYSAPKSCDCAARMPPLGPIQYRRCRRNECRAEQVPVTGTDKWATWHCNAVARTRSSADLCPLLWLDLRKCIITSFPS